MTVLGDLYQVRVKSTYDLRVTGYNMFYYRQATSTGTAADLITAWNTQVSPAWLQMIHSVVVLSEVQCINLFDPNDFSVGSVGPASGLRTGQACAPFDAIAFFSERNTRAIRRGQKRFMGVSEDDQNNGVLVGSGLSNAGDMAEVLGAQLVTGSPQQRFNPVVVKRILYVVDGKDRYRLPENDGEADWTLAVEWSYKSALSHQVSRD